MPLRLGFLGAGLVARIHQNSLSALPSRFAWGGVYDTDLKRAEKFSQETGASVCGSESELLDRCDAVYICTWTSEHPRLVEAAVRRGLDVYCEKPLAVSLELAQRMTERVQQASVIHQAGLVLRHSPAFHWLRRLIDDPRSGRLMAITFRDDQYLPVQGYYGSVWRADPARAGSGVLLEHSIHDIDILEFLGGPIDRIGCQVRHVHGIAGIEDVATATIAFRSEVTGTLITLWHDMIDRPNERRVEVFCEQLWCVLDGNFHSGPVSWQWAGESLASAQGRELLGLLQWHDEDANADAAFLRAVEERRPTHPDFVTALRAHQLVDAAYHSASSAGELVDTSQLATPHTAG